jgi:hypothetical protein
VNRHSDGVVRGKVTQLAGVIREELGDGLLDNPNPLKLGLAGFCKLLLACRAGIKGAWNTDRIKVDFQAEHDPIVRQITPFGFLQHPERRREGSS